jgi:hypothetical protein
LRYTAEGIINYNSKPWIIKTIPSLPCVLVIKSSKDSAGYRVGATKKIHLCHLLSFLAPTIDSISLQLQVTWRTFLKSSAKQRDLFKNQT